MFQRKTINFLNRCEVVVDVLIVLVNQEKVVYYNKLKVERKIVLFNSKVMS